VSDGAHEACFGQELRPLEDLLRCESFSKYLVPEDRLHLDARTPAFEAGHDCIKERYWVISIEQKKVSKN